MKSMTSGKHFVYGVQRQYTLPACQKGHRCPKQKPEKIENQFVLS